MDFPVAPHKVRKMENNHRMGEDVIVYDGGIKNVHQDFMIVFAITFAVIVVIIVTVVLIFHTIKKCKGIISARKNVPKLSVTTEAGTIIFEKEPIKSKNQAAFENINEIAQDPLNRITSREKRKQFAENKSKTSYQTSQISSHLSSIEECETCSFHSSHPSNHGSGKKLEKILGVKEGHLHLPLQSSPDPNGRRHTCTLASQRDKNSFEMKLNLIKQHSLQY